jgi:hypothetical protein
VHLVNILQKSICAVRCDTGFEIVTCTFPVSSKCSPWKTVDVDWANACFFFRF